MKIKTVLAVSILATLSACGNPVSSGAGTESQVIGSSESGFSWSKKISHIFSAKASVTIPAQAIIADALTSRAGIGGADLRSFIVSCVEGGCEDSGLTAKNIPELIKQFGPGSPIGSNAPAGSPNADKNTRDFNNSLFPILAVTAPYMGWQINMMSETDGFFGKGSSQEERLTYLAYQEASVDYTNTMFTEIASHLNSDVEVYADPATAKEAIIAEYKSIPNETKASVWKEAVETALKHHRTIDMAGSKGVDWNDGAGGSYSGNADGLVWTKAGVPWFGKGSLSGKDWKIGLESSISHNREKGTSGSEKTAGSTGEKSSTGAQPK